MSQITSSWIDDTSNLSGKPEVLQTEELEDDEKWFSIMVKEQNKCGAQAADRCAIMHIIMARLEILRW